MSNELVCPFCQQELEQVSIHDIQGWACPKLECNGYFMTATKDMWQELIRTKKQLEIAVDALTRIAVSPETMMEPEKIVPQLADLAITQIQELEQKDVK